MAVHFIDTSVLCNMVPVPGRDSDRDVVIEDLQAKVAARDVLILPVSAVVETGNFIAQVAEGQLRRSAAVKLEALLRLAANGQAPYVFHDFSWSPGFVQRGFLNGLAAECLLAPYSSRSAARKVCRCIGRGALRSRIGSA